MTKQTPVLGLAESRVVFKVVDYDEDGERNCLVVTPDGSFDGSDGARKFVAFREPGTTKLIHDDTTRRRFHHSGLLGQVGNGEP